MRCVSSHTVTGRRQRGFAWACCFSAVERWTQVSKRFGRVASSTGGPDTVGALTSLRRSSSSTAKVTTLGWRRTNGAAGGVGSRAAGC